MARSIASGIAGARVRALCAGLAMAISLMCAVLGVAASITPASGMTGMVDAADVPVMIERGEHAVAVPVAPVAAVMAVEMDGGGTSMASACDGPCLADIAGACTLAAALAVAAMLALFLASRRDTFLGLVTRAGRLLLVRRRWRDPTPWVVKSLTSLTVLRV